MGGHHLHFTASRSITGGTTIYSSVSPHRGYKWDGVSPMDGCPDFPIDDMAITGDYEMSKEQLRAYVAAKDPDYVAGEVYCNYDGGLDMFLRTGDYGRWRLYKLRMPLEPPDDYEHVPGAPYPQPKDYYMAVGKRFVRYIVRGDWTSAATDDYIDDNSRL